MPNQGCSIVTVVQDASDTCIEIASAAGIPLVTLVVNNPNVEEGCKNSCLAK
jgi:hypothetical protein